MYVIEVFDKHSFTNNNYSLGYFAGIYKEVYLSTKNILNEYDKDLLYTIKTYKSEKTANNQIRKLEDIRDKNGFISDYTFKIKELNLSEELLITQSKEEQKKIKEQIDNKKEYVYTIKLSFIEDILKNIRSHYLNNNNLSNEEQAFIIGRISILEELQKSLQTGKDQIIDDLGFKKYLKEVK